MEAFVTNIFLAITGSMIVPLVPFEYLRLFDTLGGRLLLFSLPVLAFHLLAPSTGVMAGAVVGIIIDRIHDLTPDHSRSDLGSGSMASVGTVREMRNIRRGKRDGVLLDLSPDYTKMNSTEIVMLEPVEVRRKHGVK